MRVRSIMLGLLLCFVLMAIDINVGTGPLVAASYPVKQVYVAADEEFRQRPGWQAIASDWVRRASNHFNETFGVTFNIVAYLDWTSTRTAITELLIELENSLQARGEWTRARGNVLLGLTGQATGSLVCGLAYLGGAWSMASVAMVFDYGRCTVGPDEDESRGVVVQHEISHLYGAVDRDGKRRGSPDCAATVMASSVALSTHWCQADLKQMKRAIYVR